MLNSSNNTDIYFSRYDEGCFLATFSMHGFELEGQHWPTVEHYFQAHKFTNTEYSEEIRAASSPKLAQKLGRKRRKMLREDWPLVKQTIMTRAIYCKFMNHPELTTELLTTTDQLIVENNNYDYYWGCGRDRRGHNHLGKIIMRVREKIITSN